MSIPSIAQSAQEWAALYRMDDGEQQPISPVEREFGLESQARRHGLELIRPLLGVLGDPHLSYPTIHVGGSKGKGSTVALLTAIFRAAGYRVGSYISPSLTHFGERIQVDGRSITDQEAEEHLVGLRRALAAFDERPRFFEAASIVAFQHFARAAVDVAVVEVGLGGERDATNVIMPELSVITSIELEHTHILGDTLAAIAREKAGIIKPGIPTVTAVSEAEPLEPIVAACANAGASLWRLDRDFGVAGLRSERTRQCFDLWLGRGLGNLRLSELVLSMPGEAQSSNAALAVVAARLLSERYGWLSEAAIRQGLRDARWPGRLELHEGRPSFLLDVAHTPASARQLRRYLDRYFPQTPKTLVVGLLRDKNAPALASELAAAFDSVIVAPVKWFRSMEPELLRDAFGPHLGQVEIAASVCTGIEMARAATPPAGLIVVAGSVFGVGEAKRRFGWV